MNKALKIVLIAVIPGGLIFGAIYYFFFRKSSAPPISVRPALGGIAGVGGANNNSTTTATTNNSSGGASIASTALSSVGTIFGIVSKIFGGSGSSTSGGIGGTNKSLVAQSIAANAFGATQVDGGLPGFNDSTFGDTSFDDSEGYGSGDVIQTYNSDGSNYDFSDTFDNTGFSDVGAFSASPDYGDFVDYNGDNGDF